MLAGTPSLNSGRSVQSFARSPHSAVPSGSLLATNDRVVISRQDGSGWAISMGTITDVLPGPQVRVVLDKPVPHEEDVLYRIDQVSGYSGGAAYCNLADLCTSDSEKWVTLCVWGQCASLVVLSEFEPGANYLICYTVHGPGFRLHVSSTVDQNVALTRGVAYIITCHAVHLRFVILGTCAT